MDYKFVSLHLDVATTIIVEDETIHVDDALDWLTGKISEGYKISLSYHLEKSSYIASMTGKDSKANKGLVLSQWAGSIEKAAQKLYIIHEILCGGDNWGLAESRMATILREALKR